jgi:hypothetical protein
MTHRWRQIANENAQGVGRMSASVIRRTAGYAANLVKTILAANPPYLPRLHRDSSLEPHEQGGL